MATFYQISFSTPGSSNKILQCSKDFEQFLKGSLNDSKSWFVPEYLGTSRFDEFYLSHSNFLEKDETFFCEFSKKINSYWGTVESLDGENSNFALFYKGEIIFKYTNFPESEYNSPMFKRAENIINISKMAEILGLNQDEANMFGEAIKLKRDEAYFKISQILQIKNKEYEPY